MRIMLNVIKRDNFVFLDVDNGIHLNRVYPFGYPTKITPALSRAIAAGCVIDIDNSFDIKISDIQTELNEAILKAFNITPIEKRPWEDLEPSFKPWEDLTPAEPVPPEIPEEEPVVLSEEEPEVKTTSTRKRKAK